MASVSKNSSINETYAEICDNSIRKIEKITKGYKLDDVR